MVKTFALLLLLGCAGKPAVDAAVANAKGEPSPLVSISDVDPSIVVDARYFTSHNFVGRPIQGYKAGKCLLTKEAAEALKAVQADVKAQRFSLKVYDCYRPQRAVNDFVTWSKDTSDQKTKGEFYPRVDKKDAFKLGYIAEKSGHSRGSTMDLTLIPITAPAQAEYKDGEKLVDCAAPYAKRFKDNTIDMGTGYDCFDPLAATANPKVGAKAKKNRAVLKAAMEKHGFKNYENEWWHFTLTPEPFPNTYFDFEVQ